MLKKISLCVSISLLFVILTNSCSYNYNEPVTLTKFAAEPDNDKILSVFIDINKSLKPLPKSRALSRADWFSVVCADVVAASTGARTGATVGSYFGPKGTLIGTIAGGVIVGAAGSYLEYDRKSEKYGNIADGQRRSNSLEYERPNEESFQESFAIAKASIEPNDYLIGISLEFDSTSTEIGILHNKVLKNTCEDIANFEPLGGICLDSLESAIVNHSEFVAELKTTLGAAPVILYDKDICDKVIDLFCDALKSSCNSKEDLYFIIAEYKSKIHELATKGYIVIEETITGHKSSRYAWLTIDEAERLYAALAVAAYSYEYWSVAYPYVE